jgi:hypothetical protein
MGRVEVPNVAGHPESRVLSPLSWRPVRSVPPIDHGWRLTVETAIGIALIVIAALMIVFIVRTVQSNLPRV